MSNDLSLFPSQIDISKMYQDSKITPQVASGGIDFLTFKAHDGVYESGKLKEDVTGMQVVVSPDSLRHGWVLFKGAGAPDKVMGTFIEPIPDSMPSIMVGGVQKSPSEARSFSGYWYDSDKREMENAPLQFDTNSQGGREAFDSLHNRLREHIIGRCERTFVCPIIRLDVSDSYVNKHSGKEVWNPIFTIIDWVDCSGRKKSDPVLVVEKEEPAIEKETAHAAPSAAEATIRKRRVRPTTNV